MWKIFVITGLIFVILEMLVPSMFFLNLAVGGFVTAIVALWVSDWITLILTFVGASVLSILFLRPLLVKQKTEKDKETGMEGKYIGKIVKVIEPVNKHSGVITIYDERWQARTNSDEIIPEGSEVRIVRYDSLILTVEKI